MQIGIRCVYKGVNLRSLLEFKWAVFFDRLGVTWLYEPRKFLLTNGLEYTPDFYLPDVNAYVEIKFNTRFVEAQHLLFQRDVDKYHRGAAAFIACGTSPPGDCGALVSRLVAHYGRSYDEAFSAYTYATYARPKKIGATQ